MPPQVHDDELYVVINAGCRDKDLAHIGKHLKNWQVHHQARFSLSLHYPGRYYTSCTAACAVVLRAHPSLDSESATATCVVHTYTHARARAHTHRVRASRCR